MWEIPASAVIQVHDAALSMQGVELRWTSGGIDIDAILDGKGG